LEETFDSAAVISNITIDHGGIYVPQVLLQTLDTIVELVITESHSVVFHDVHIFGHGFPFESSEPDGALILITTIQEDCIRFFPPELFDRR
jgi:hypothetical protein